MRFSQRQGIVAPRTLLQKDDMDDDLRSLLWNIVFIFYLSPFESIRYLRNDDHAENRARKLWHFYLKRPLDDLSPLASIFTSEVKEHFFNIEWHGVYDLLEWIAEDLRAQNDPDFDRHINACNRHLEEEHSAYRFVGGLITPITSNEELAEIGSAQAVSGDKFDPAARHIQSAIKLISDKQNPDFRNSIKESISAVEAACCIIAGDKKATLGQALSKLEGTGTSIHPALKQAFDKLYGYASDAGGIRHKLLEDSNLGFDDAKFMLVTCSAFINYLKSKAPSS